jgi:Orange carotenoid protein, N-terminal
MTYTTSNTASDLAARFQALDVEQQLALFYYIYKEMGHTITPAAPGASTVSPEIATGLFDQVQEMSQDEQLQVQKDLISGQDSLISREYGSLGDTTKLLFWYYLAQGMDNGSIISMPTDYKLSSDAESLFGQIQSLEFNQQITLFRNIVSPMGVDSTQSEHDSAVEV